MDLTLIIDGPRRTSVPVKHRCACQGVLFTYHSCQGVLFTYHSCQEVLFIDYSLLAEQGLLLRVLASCGMAVVVVVNLHMRCQRRGFWARRCRQQHSTQNARGPQHSIAWFKAPVPIAKRS